MAKEAYYVAKETYSYSKRGLTTLTTSAYLRRSLAHCQGRCQKRPIYMAQEAHSLDKRGLVTLAYLRRSLAPAVRVDVKRGLFTWQKRPIHLTKEAW